MALVDYSDSDSDAEEIPAAKAPTTTTNSSKPAFQKVVDRSNPGKIRVSLPQTLLKEDTSDEPPTKRAKIGVGGFGGFNSFLPAPKRTGQAANITLGGGNTAKKSGLAAGVSLKTGVAPGFSREPEAEREYWGEGHDEGSSSNAGIKLSLPAPKASLVEGQKPEEEVKLVGKPLMFKPLSVTRKPAKKKKQVATVIPTNTTPITPQNTTKARTKPKVSLFSLSAELTSSASASQASNGVYEPLIYEPPNDEEDGADASYLNPTYEDYTPTTSQFEAPPSVPTPPVSQSLDDIAGDLHLSAAERRQLFGRQKGGAKSATNIINFNTDKEYLHNEELRAAGEQVVHNPVRAIAPGKHNLKQLVNAAQSQKEALEESFAKGKNNRAEASSRYGW